MGGDSILELIRFVYFEATGRELSYEDAESMLQDYKPSVAVDPDPLPGEPLGNILRWNQEQ